MAPRCAVATREFTKVYVDGEATTVEGSWPNHGRSDFNVNIGGCGIWDGDGNWFTGAMDEVGLFHAPLSDDDIADVMNNGLQVYGVAVEPAGKDRCHLGNAEAARLIRARRKILRRSVVLPSPQRLFGC